MSVFEFECARCGAVLTAPLSQVALPVHAHQIYGNGTQLPVLMEPGTFAVDPEPWGPPWRMWEDIDPDEATARGIHAPVHALSDGAPGTIAIAPGDTRGTVLIPENGSGACCGLGGGDGPNMACEACGLPVATRVDDCSQWQVVWLAPNAVRRRLVDNTGAALRSWAELLAAGRSTPPFASIPRWGDRSGGPHHHWAWSPQWEAAAGRALAHLLVASRGGPVTVPYGMVEEVFQRALDTLLPTGPAPRRAVLAGPGLPVPDAHADMLIVPTHPQTAEVWAPDGTATSAYLVPMPFGVWLCLAFPAPHLPIPASGVMPAGVLRDDPPLPRAHHRFRADWRVFQHTLVRLPAAGDPWLRKILEDRTPHSCVF
ncbi:hypothetical protein BBN63_19425 [Streptomyces niveus]|uniref:Uncharacterized protein n=1 Tax=Streptomyces niveus TaxID=193462 RepID=A0A1U9QUY2_STRNV|nr:hypothetical protein BBN63_19425 [Streptomyces niveus]